MTATAEPSAHDAIRRANDMMWESLSTGGYDGPIPFFCECVDPTCYQAVWMTRGEYERARLDRHWHPLRTGHRPAGPHT